MKRNSGFTLIELLVVLAVMGLMMGVVGFSLLSGGGAELGASQRSLMGVLQQARTKAASSGLNARVIVYGDPADADKFHRYFEVVLEDPNATRAEPRWIVLNEGTYLEEGIYFVPESTSASARPDDWPTDAFSAWSHDDSETFKLEDSFKGYRLEGQGTEFHFLEFDSGGNLVLPSISSGQLAVVPRIVLAKGAPNPIDPAVPLRFDSANAVGGILLHKFGGFSTLEITDFMAP